jgi:hypothetical protein
MDNPTTLPTNKLNTTPTAGPTNSPITSPTTGRLAFHSATLSGINKEEYVAAIVFKGSVDRKKTTRSNIFFLPTKTTRRKTEALL